MIGIDLIEIERVLKSSANEAFYKKVFTENERNYYEKNGKKAETLAGMWAAKEAVAKAIGLGFNRGFSFQDIEITHNNLGAPSVVLSEKAKPLFEKFTVFISITHNATTAAAVCALYPIN